MYQKSRTGKCTQRFSGTRTLCCNQVLKTNTFMGEQKKRTFNLFLTLTVKVNMQDLICRKCRDGIYPKIKEPYERHQEIFLYSSLQTFSGAKTYFQQICQNHHHLQTGKFTQL